MSCARSWHGKALRWGSPSICCSMPRHQRGRSSSEGCGRTRSLRGRTSSLPCPSAAHIPLLSCGAGKTSRRGYVLSEGWRIRRAQKAHPLIFPFKTIHAHTCSRAVGGRIVGHHVHGRPDYAVFLLLPFLSQQAKALCPRWMAVVVPRSLPAEALETGSPEFRLNAPAQREHLPEIAARATEHPRCLHEIACILVFRIHGIARIEQVIFLQVVRLVVLPGGDDVLHEHAAVAGLPLPPATQCPARLEGKKQLVAIDVHDAMPQPVHAIIVIERIILNSADAAAHRRDAAQPCAPHFIEQPFHDAVIIPRPAERVSVSECRREVAFAVPDRSPSDGVHDLVAAFLYRSFPPIITLDGIDGCPGTPFLDHGCIGIFHLRGGRAVFSHICPIAEAGE